MGVFRGRDQGGGSGLQGEEEMHKFFKLKFQSNIKFSVGFGVPQKIRVLPTKVSPMITAC